MDFKKYEMTIPYPEKPRIPEIRLLKNFGYHIDNYIEYLENEVIVNLKQYKQNVIIYNTKRTLYNNESNRLHDLFKQDCFIEYGIENHPKRELVFEKAWSDGHAYGYSEAFNCMEKYVDLVKD
jgi:hypothetical protein